MLPKNTRKEEVEQERHLKKNVSRNSICRTDASGDEEAESTVAVRNKPTLGIDIPKTKSEKYHSGGGTPPLSAKLSVWPQEFHIESIGAPRQGMQAKVDFVRIRTDSESTVDVVRKKEKREGNFSLDNEIKMSDSIKNHPEYEKVKSYLSLPFYDEKRSSGNEMYSRLKKNGDLESCREFIKQNPSAAQTYLYRQVKNMVTALDFLHNGEFEDDAGNKHKGIIHGDIKPDNMLVDKNGDLSLSDFGCARYADETIQQLGMVTYLSPELLKACAGEVPSNPGKADIWGLGVTLRYLRTGEYPIAPSPASNMIAMSAIPSHDEKDMRAYLIKETKQGYTTIGANQVGDKSDHFFSDTLPGQEIRIKKANEFLQSEICRENLESKKIIEDLCKDTFQGDLNQNEIFHHLTASLLLPVEARPTAKELAETMEKLARYFPCDQKSNAEFVKKMTASTQPVAEKIPQSSIPKEENKVLLKPTQEKLEPKLSADRQSHKQLLDHAVGGASIAWCSFYSAEHQQAEMKTEKNKSEKTKQMLWRR